MIFNLIFKLIFSYLKSQKGDFLPAGDDVVSSAWRAGPRRGCDATLRPRARAAGGPREAQVAHRARTRGRTPRVSTPVLAATVWGATWQGGCHLAGPRVSGPW